MSSAGKSADDQAGKAPPPSIEPLAVDAETAAALFGVSARHWWALHSSGRCPMPIRFGRAVRWNVAELRDWLAAGAPERSRWAAIRNEIPK